MGHQVMTICKRASAMTEFDALVAERLAEVQARIAGAGGVGITVLPVTKNVGWSVLGSLPTQGCGAVGENYAQEVVAKLGGIQRHFEVHFIGQLQTNKVRQLAPIVSVYETVDRPSVVAELAKYASLAHGCWCRPQHSLSRARAAAHCNMPALVDAAQRAGLSVQGLMTVGPPKAALTLACRLPADDDWRCWVCRSARWV